MALETDIATRSSLHDRVDVPGRYGSFASWTVWSRWRDLKEHGKIAGLIAKQILSGKKAGDLPLTANKRGYVIVNNAAAVQMGIEVPHAILTCRIPAGSILPLGSAYIGDER